METLDALLALCEGNPPVTIGHRWISPHKEPVLSSDVSFVDSMKQLLDKQTKQLIWPYCNDEVNISEFLYSCPNDYSLFRVSLTVNMNFHWAVSRR